MSKPATGQPGAGTADPPKDTAPQDDDKKTTPAGTPPAEGDGDDDDDAGQSSPKPKTFTQEEVNRLLSKERRAAEKKQQEAEERAKLSEQERLQKEASDLRAQLAERDARDAVASEASKLGATNPSAVYKLIREDLEFDDKGKITNLGDTLAEAKDSYPELFVARKPDGVPPDAGEGAGKGAGKLLSKDEMDKMTPDQINKSWDLVQKSLAALKK